MLAGGDNLSIIFAVIHHKHRNVGTVPLLLTIGKFFAFSFFFSSNFIHSFLILLEYKFDCKLHCILYEYLVSRLNKYLSINNEINEF